MVSLWPDDGSLSQKPVTHICIRKRSVGCDCVINKRKYTFVSAHQRGCSVLKLV
jgi:hypothetical protein